MPVCTVATSSTEITCPTETMAENFVFWNMIDGLYDTRPNCLKSRVRVIENLRNAVKWDVLPHVRPRYSLVFTTAHHMQPASSAKPLIWSLVLILSSSRTGLFKFNNKAGPQSIPHQVISFSLKRYILHWNAKNSTVWSWLHNKIRDRLKFEVRMSVLVHIMFKWHMSTLVTIVTDIYVAFETTDISCLYQKRHHVIFRTYTQ